MADPNRAIFERAVELLEPLLDELVFVGGCATGLLVTDSAAGGIRPTKDVDAIVRVASRSTRPSPTRCAFLGSLKTPVTVHRSVDFDITI